MVQTKQKKGNVAKYKYHTNITKVYDCSEGPPVRLNMARAVQ